MPRARILKTTPGGPLGFGLLDKMNEVVDNITKFIRGLWPS